MSFRDLRAKYGDLKAKRAVNAAIRGEIPGGNETLDALAQLRSNSVLLSSDAGQLAERLILDIIDAQAQEIARRYNLGGPNSEF